MSVVYRTAIITLYYLLSVLVILSIFRLSSNNPKYKIKKETCHYLKNLFFIISSLIYQIVIPPSTLTTVPLI